MLEMLISEVLLSGLLTVFMCVNRHLSANTSPSLEMENEEKIRLEARRRLEEQLKQYRVQRHKERVSSGTPSSI